MPTLLQPDYKMASREAMQLLIRAGVVEPPIDPVDIARSLGVDVSFVRFSGESEDVAGLYDPKDDSILVNREQAGVRQTFTVAHELGHRVLHRAWAESSDYKVLWRDPKRQNNDRFEREANRFAETLLMPKNLVDEYRSLPVFQIAKIFAVSEQVAQIRMSNLYGY